MMNDKERAKLTVIRAAIDGAYTVAKAAEKLGVSKRRVKELKRMVRERGDGAVIHGNSGRNPANTTNTAIVRRIVSLKKSAMYEKANFAHFRELPEERENIKISYSCLRSALTKAGVVSPKTRRSSGVWTLNGLPGAAVTNPNPAVIYLEAGETKLITVKPAAAVSTGTITINVNGAYPHLPATAVLVGQGDNSQTLDEVGGSYNLVPGVWWLAGFLRMDL